MVDETASSKTELFYFKVLFFASYLGAVNASFKFIPAQILGFALTGYAWLIVFLVSVYYILLFKGKTTFPLLFWLPWLIYLCLSLGFNFSTLGLQSTVQLLVPVLVGMVTASFEYSDYILSKILLYFKYLLVTLFLGATIFSYISYGVWGLGIATYAHLASVCAVISIGLFYNNNDFKYGWHYLIALIIPIICTTRMGIAILFSIPFLFFSSNLGYKRISLLLGLLLIANSILFLPKIQKKMFYSGKGGFSELNISNPDLQTNGRRGISEYTLKKAKEKPYFGHGPRADFYLLKSKFPSLTELHNDYLQIFYNYGKVGLFLFFIPLVFAFLAILRMQANSTWFVFIKSVFLTLYFPLFGFMLTDTTIKTSFSFMNYFFALLGIVYAINFNEKHIIELNEDFSCNPTVQ
jgi:O-antigen ligase